MNAIKKTIYSLAFLTLTSCGHKKVDYTDYRIGEKMPTVEEFNEASNLEKYDKLEDKISDGRTIISNFYNDKENDIMYEIISSSEKKNDVIYMLVIDAKNRFFLINANNKTNEIEQMTRDGNNVMAIYDAPLIDGKTTDINDGKISYVQKGLNPEKWQQTHYNDSNKLTKKAKKNLYLDFFGSK